MFKHYRFFSVSATVLNCISFKIPKICPIMFQNSSEISINTFLGIHTEVATVILPEMLSKVLPKPSGLFSGKILPTIIPEFGREFFSKEIFSRISTGNSSGIFFFIFESSSGYSFKKISCLWEIV